MGYKNIKCFNRLERDGWRLLVPLEGPRTADSCLFNPQAYRILEWLEQGITPSDICHALQKEFPDVPHEKIQCDVSATVYKLAALGVYDMDEQETKEICGSSANRLPGIHVMDESEMRMVSQRLVDARTEQFLFCNAQVNTEQFQTYRLRHMHFSALETFILHNDQAGKLNGVLSLYGMGTLSSVLVVTMMTAFGNDKTDRATIAISMLRQLESLASVMSYGAKIRFIVQKKRTDVGVDQEQVHFQCDLELCEDIWSECGYRREATLLNEIAQGIDVTYYSRAIERSASKVAQGATALRC